MSKNKSPYPGKKKSEPAPRTKTRANGDGGRPGGPQPKRKCWDFEIVSPTEASGRAMKEMSVNGVPQGSQVSVHAEIGMLGYAPAGVAKQMIAALQKSRGTLLGEITSIDARGRVKVHICVS